MAVTPHHLRRYVIERESGRVPHPEWCFYEASIGAWIRADKATAKRHQHYRRIRKSGQHWCDVMGHRTSVADDVVLQTYFLTVDPDGWSRLAAAVREHPRRCLREWAASGMRIISAVTDDPAANVSGNDRALTG